MYRLTRWRECKQKLEHIGDYNTYEEACNELMHRVLWGRGTSKEYNIRFIGPSILW